MMRRDCIHQNRINAPTRRDTAETSPPKTVEKEEIQRRTDVNGHTSDD